MGTRSGHVVRIVLGAPNAAPTRESSILLDPAVAAIITLFDTVTGFLYVTDVRRLHVPSLGHRNSRRQPGASPSPSTHSYNGLPLYHTLPYPLQYDTIPSVYFKIATRAASGGGTTLIATGPKHPVARGAKTVLRLRLVAPKIAAGVPKKTKAGVLAGTNKKGNTTYYSVTLDVPAGTTVLHASTPLGAGKNNKAVITATQVFWPRVPLKEGRAFPQKVHLKVTAKIAKSSVSPLLFDAVAENLDTGATLTAEPSPLEVQLK